MFHTTKQSNDISTAIYKAVVRPYLNYADIMSDLKFKPDEIDRVLIRIIEEGDKFNTKLHKGGAPAIKKLLRYGADPNTTVVSSLNQTYRVLTCIELAIVKEAFSAIKVLLLGGAKLETLCTDTFDIVNHYTENSLAKLDDCIRESFRIEQLSEGFFRAVCQYGLPSTLDIILEIIISDKNSQAWLTNQLPLPILDAVKKLYNDSNTSLQRKDTYEKIIASLEKVLAAFLSVSTMSDVDSVTSSEDVEMKASENRDSGRNKRKGSPDDEEQVAKKCRVESKDEKNSNPSALPKSSKETDAKSAENFPKKLTRNPQISLSEQRFFFRAVRKSTRPVQISNPEVTAFTVPSSFS